VRALPCAPHVRPAPGEQQPHAGVVEALAPATCSQEGTRLGPLFSEPTRNTDLGEPGLRAGQAVDSVDWSWKLSVSF
jgi:hypothetical protein